jgi:xanthine dehydrogenase/oxidase
LKNFYQEGDLTHYGQKLIGVHAKRIYEELLVSSRFAERRAEIDAWNKNHRWKKRGLAFVPTKFGMSFTARFLNQAGALVHVYTDGTVLVTHGGTEMGQGLHTKIAQITADAFGISVNSVYISETSTDKVPNTSPTAASVSSDMYGYAVYYACQQIKERLAPYYEKNPNATLAEVASTAHRDRVCLSSTGFYATPELDDYKFDGTPGSPFYYFKYVS